MAEELDIANACDFEGRLKPGLYSKQELWQICTASGNFGHCIYVWGGNIEDAIEHAIDFADENGWCGWFTFLEESDFRDAAKQLGIPWQDDWPDWNDRNWEKVAEEAEADLTTIGHTTLRCQPKEAWGAYTGYDWSATEVTDPQELEEVARRSMEKCWGHRFLIGDSVYYPGHVDEQYPEDSIPGGVYEVTEADDSIYIEGNGQGTHVLPANIRPHDPRDPTQRPQKTEGERLLDFFFPKRRGSYLMNLKSWGR